MKWLNRNSYGVRIWYDIEIDGTMGSPGEEPRQMVFVPGSFSSKRIAKKRAKKAGYTEYRIVRRDGETIKPGWKIPWSMIDQDLNDWN